MFTEHQPALPPTENTSLEFKARGLAVACFVSSLAAALLMVLHFAMDQVLQVAMPEGVPSTLVSSLFWGFGVCVLVGVVGLGLGMGAVYHEQGRNRFALYGMLFSAIVVLTLGSVLINQFTFGWAYL